MNIAKTHGFNWKNNLICAAMWWNGTNYFLLEEKILIFPENFARVLMTGIGQVWLNSWPV